MTYAERRSLGLCAQTGCTARSGARSRCPHHAKLLAARRTNARSKRHLQRVRTKLRHGTPPWMDLIPCEAPNPNGGEGTILTWQANPSRPNRWHEIVCGDRVMIHSTREVDVLRTVLAPGERLVLAERDGGKGFARAKRWWLP